MSNKITIKDETNVSKTFLTNKDYSSLITENPKIYALADGSYTIVKSILIDKNRTPKSYKELKPSEKEEISNVLDLQEFYQKKSKKKVSSIVALHFEKESENAHKILLVSNNSEIDFIETDLNGFSNQVKALNNQANNVNTSVPNEPAQQPNEAINTQRDDNTSTALFKALVGTDKDNALMIDKILHLKFSKQALIFTNTPENQDVKTFFEANKNLFEPVYEFAQKAKMPVFILNNNKELDSIAKSVCARVDLEEMPAPKALVAPTKPVVDTKTPDDKKGKKKEKPQEQMTFKF